MATKGKKKVDAPVLQPDINDKEENKTPPLKPFIKSESRNLGGQSDQFIQPAIPRHFGRIPGIPRHGEGTPAHFDDFDHCEGSSPAVTD